MLLRLIFAYNVIDDSKALFCFELCIYPSALFDDTLMSRAPHKAVLANAIWTRLPPDIAGQTGEVQYVLGGGALLHRITLEGARASTGLLLLCVDVGYKQWSNDRPLCA